MCDVFLSLHTQAWQGKDLNKLRETISGYTMITPGSIDSTTQQVCCVLCVHVCACMFVCVCVRVVWCGRASASTKRVLSHTNTHESLPLSLLT